jgi:hypothetical protein
VEAEIFHANRQRDAWTVVTKFIVMFHDVLRIKPKPAIFLNSLIYVFGAVIKTIAQVLPQNWAL